MPTPDEPVVHLELHTRDRTAARDFYTRLFGWRAETIDCRSGSYQALELGDGIDGGIVECPTARPVWLPYVSVPDVTATMESARELGSAVLLEPREGPAGWRSVLVSPAGAEIGLWQAKKR